jgi:hypothetical protein
LLEMSSSLSFSSAARSVGSICRRLPLRDKLYRFSNLERMGIMS